MESTPSRFEDRQAAQRWIESTFAAWANSLSESERAAVLAYKGTAHDRINDALRLGIDALADDDEQLIEELDRALSRFRLPEPVVAFRGFESETLRWAIDNDDLVGDTIRDLGYHSTSLLRIVAVDFVSTMSSGWQLIEEVAIPGGAQIGAFVAAPDMVRNVGELEILLPRDGRFRVTAVHPQHDPPTIQTEVILE